MSLTEMPHVVGVSECVDQAIHAMRRDEAGEHGKEKDVAVVEVFCRQR